MHSFNIIADATKKQCAAGASFEKMVEYASFFEVEKVVDKKGVEYFNQIEPARPCDFRKTLWKQYNKNFVAALADSPALATSF